MGEVERKAGGKVKRGCSKYIHLGLLVTKGKSQSQSYQLLLTEM